MTRAATSLDLIETAIESLKQAMPQGTGGSAADGIFMPTETGGGGASAIGVPSSLDYRIDPVTTVVGLCLRAALGLLVTAQGLLRPSLPGLSAPVRARHWQVLAERTRLAGRMAYRAVLVLLDPVAAERAGVLEAQSAQRPAPVLNPPLPTGPREVDKSVHFEHWSAIQNDRITASEFIEFLRPLADLDGVFVSYLVSDKAAGDTPGASDAHAAAWTPLAPTRIGGTGAYPSSKKTLSFALNRDGGVWVQSNFGEL